MTATLQHAIMELYRPSRSIARRLLPIVNNPFLLLVLGLLASVDYGPRPMLWIDDLQPLSGSSCRS